MALTHVLRDLTLTEREQRDSAARKVIACYRMAERFGSPQAYLEILTELLDELCRVYGKEPPDDFGVAKKRWAHRRLERGALGQVRGEVDEACSRSADQLLGKLRGRIFERLAEAVSE